VKTPIKTDAGTVNDAVKSVTWTASGPGIGAGQFQEFRVSVGLPADADSLTFPTTQTYTDGETVNWVQVTPPGGPEPDSPAPVLTLTNGAPTAGTTPTTTAPTGGTAAASNVKKSDVDNAKTIAIIGVVVGALGLLAGIGGLTMGRRKSA
jgi:uncharacterized protein YcnI